MKISLKRKAFFVLSIVLGISHILFKLYSRTLPFIYHYIHFYRGGKETQKLNNWLTVAQLGYGWTKIQTYISLTLNLIFFALY